MLRSVSSGKLRILSVALSVTVGAIMVPAASAASAAPASVSSCQTLDSPGAYVLSSDLAAVDATCIEVTASDVKLDLAGHTMLCTGSGFAGSCQVPEFTSHGILVEPGLTGVMVTGPGTITGFRNGVAVVGSYALVKGVTITAPACDPDNCPRPFGQGIFVGGKKGDTEAGPIEVGPVGTNLSGNRVSNYERGIALWGAQCQGTGAGCTVSQNVIRDNGPCLGMLLLVTTGYTVTHNVVRSNGTPSCDQPPGGIAVGWSTGNVIAGNDVSDNTGFGIGIFPDTNGNTIVNNTVKGNTDVDLFAWQGTGNRWNDNNRCNTSIGEVPPSVCGPGE